MNPELREIVAELRRYAQRLASAGEEPPQVPGTREATPETTPASPPTPVHGSRQGVRPLPPAPARPGPPDEFSLSAPEVPAEKAAAARGPVPIAALPKPEHADLAAMNRTICTCVKCPLGTTRTKFVFGEGNPKAGVVFVGEAPGENEDLQGRPFVGRAGQLLDRLLADVRLRRQDVFICNVLKCRPPGNRTPLPDEIATCEPYLFQQLALIRPKAIVCLGAPAAQTILRTKKSIGALRGQVFDFLGIKVVPTYHPAFLLRPNGAPMIATVRDDIRLAISQASR